MIIFKTNKQNKPLSSMQVFLPHKSPIDCARTICNDNKRFNKQIVECKQILSAIDGTGKGWFNHPVTKMYKPYRQWLFYYTNCLECYREYMKEKEESIVTKASYLVQSVLWSEKADEIRPSFITDKFCNQHKRRLYTKSNSIYPQFAEYGTSEENWYYVDGELLKYVNGKRLN